jgi:transcriptional regulator with XRE-family HTH domain
MCAIRTIIEQILVIINSVEKKNVIGGRIKKARLETNPRVTQNELAARLQVLDVDLDRTMLSKIENGIRPIYDYEIIAIAKALKLDYSWLLDGNKNNSTPK